MLMEDFSFVSFKQKKPLSFIKTLCLLPAVFLFCNACPVALSAMKFGPLEAVRGEHSPAVYPQTRVLLRTRKKLWQGQKLINPWWLLTPISRQSTGAYSGEIRSPLSPIKVHTLCPQIPVNGMSVLRERVCVYVSKEAWWRSRRSGEPTIREMVLVTFRCFISVRGIMLGKPCLDIQPNWSCKSQPRRDEIIHDEALVFLEEVFSTEMLFSFAFEKNTIRKGFCTFTTPANIMATDGSDCLRRQSLLTTG